MNKVNAQVQAFMDFIKAPKKDRTLKDEIWERLPFMTLENRCKEVLRLLKKIETEYPELTEGAAYAEVMRMGRSINDMKLQMKLLFDAITRFTNHSP